MAVVALLVGVVGLAGGVAGRVDPANWMKETPGLYNATLLDIVVPGTHDAGAYELIESICPGSEDDPLLDLIEGLAGEFVWDITHAWSLCQSGSFYEQFATGVRYVDFRACMDVGENRTNIWRTYHTVLGNPFQMLLDDTRRFLEDHPGEVLILEIGHLNSPSSTADREALMDMIEAALGPLLYPRGDRVDALTIGEMVARNQRVLATVSQSSLIENRPGFWFSDVYEGAYSNQNTVEPMIAHAENQVLTAGGRGRLHRLFWTLTPRPEDIARGLAPRAPIKSIEDLSAEAAPLLPEFFERFSTFQLGNIILIDYVEQSPLVDLVIADNARNCQDRAEHRAPEGGCRDWAREGRCSEAEVAQACPRSCGAC